MYSHEIADYLKQRGYVLETEELFFITDVKNHPQISHILFHPENSMYEMWDKEGGYFCFFALPYQEKRLIKEKEIFHKK